MFEKWHQTSEDQREGHLTLEDLEQLYAYIVQCNTALLEQLKALPYSGIPLPAREETGRPPPYNTLTNKEQHRVSIESQTTVIESTTMEAESTMTSAEYAAGRITYNEVRKRRIEKRLDYVLWQARFDSLPQLETPYEGITPEEQGTLHTARMALGDLKGVLAIKGKKALADWEAGRIATKAFGDRYDDNYMHESALWSHQFMLSWDLDTYRESYKQAHPHTRLTRQETRRVHIETKAIATESKALFIEAKKVLADQQAGHITFEESEKVFADIDKRLKALEERFKVLPMPPCQSRSRVGFDIHLILMKFDTQNRSDGSVLPYTFRTAGALACDTILGC